MDRTKSTRTPTGPARDPRIVMPSPSPATGPTRAVRPVKSQPKFSDTKEEPVAAQPQEEPPADPRVVSEWFKSANPDHYTTTEYVKLKDLYIDPDIQRGVEESEVQSFVDNFNPLALGSLILSRRPNGLLSLLDGQQRTTAAGRVGYEEDFEAIVHHGLSVPEEARLFLDLQRRRNVNVWRRFKTRVTAEEQQAVAIMRILTELNIPFGGVKGFAAIATADKVYVQSNGPARLRWSLQMVRDIYDDDGRGRCYNGKVIEAFALLHTHYLPSIDEQRLVEKLAQVGDGSPGVHKLLGHGRIIQSVKNCPLPVAVGDAIIDYYNRSKRRNPNFPSRLPDLPKRKPATKVITIDHGDEE